MKRWFANLGQLKLILAGEQLHLQNQVMTISLQLAVRRQISEMFATEAQKL